MANRTLGDFTRSRLVVPDLPQDLSGANLLKQVSRQTGVWANEAIADWQEAEKSKAATAGAIAGQQENVKYREGGTLTSDAFNAAARKSLVTMTDLKAKIGMQELSETYKDDPAMFQLKSKEFIGTISDGIKQTGDTVLAKETEASMTLAAQTAGYEISKAFGVQQVDKAKADNEMLLHTLQTDSYKGSGGLFSPDPEEQGIALTKFAINKKAYEANLHAVLPDGSPVYSATAIQKRMQSFHTKFYTGAVQNWVSEANLSTKELKKIKDGTLTVDIPGVGSINVLDEVGVDAYDKDVRRYTVAKIREKVAAEAKKLALEKDLMEDQRNKNDILLLNDLYTGQPTSSTSIISQVEAGKISATVAKSAIQMLNDPNTIVDDTAFVADLKVKQIMGEDITQTVKSNANRISSTSYKSLLSASATAQVKAEKTAQSEDEKWIVREMVQKSAYGVEDPKSIRLAGDTVDSYRQKIKDGMTPELAFEEIRTTMDALKDRANRRAFNSVPKYNVITNNTIDLMKSAQATGLAYKTGKINKETFNIEMGRLNAIKQRKRGVNTNAE